MGSKCCRSDINVVPGLQDKPFVIKMDRSWLKKGDILAIDTSGSRLIVTKVFKQTWWRKLLLFLGFKVRLLACKVEVAAYKAVEN